MIVVPDPMANDMDEVMRAMEAARARFEAETEALVRQRESASKAEAAAIESKAQHDREAAEYAAQIDKLMAIKDLRIEDGSLVVDFLCPHFAMGVLALSFADSLGDAKNYVETYWRLPESDGVVAVTIRRKYGKTPAEIVTEMREVMAKLANEFEGADCRLCGGETEHDPDCIVLRARALCFVPSKVHGTDLPVPA